MTPTHWMDDRRRVVTDAWLQSPAATSDYRDTYNVPCHHARGKIRPLYPCETCAGTGEDFNEGDPCHVCGGSGGRTAP